MRIKALLDVLYVPQINFLFTYPLTQWNTWGNVSEGPEYKNMSLNLC